MNTKEKKTTSTSNEAKHNGAYILMMTELNIE